MSARREYEQAIDGVMQAVAQQRRIDAVLGYPQLTFGHAASVAAEAVLKAHAAGVLDAQVAP